MSNHGYPVLITAVGELSPIELKKLRADMDVAGTLAASHLNAARFEIAMLLTQAVVAAAKLGDPAVLRRRMGLLGDAGRVNVHGVVDALRGLASEYDRRGHAGLLWCLACLMSAIDCHLAELDVEIRVLEAAFYDVP